MVWKRDCLRRGSLTASSQHPGDYKQAMTANGHTASALYAACARNEVYTLRKILGRGVTKEEAMEVDINGRNGLMVACYKGYLEIVYSLLNCPFLDINLQDNDGNTALMIASQAGRIGTVMYLLNYFPGIDTEIRDCRGFTALIKAAMSGRNDIVSALVMAGADIHAVDSTRGKCVRDWALTTGRYDTLHRLRRLALRPKAEQFCESYVAEWPELKERVDKAIAAERGPSSKITQRLKNTFGFSIPRDPQDNGVMDHMVRMTTGIHSPLVVTGCRPLCPTSPPEVGKRRLAVQELAKKHTKQELQTNSVCHSNGSVSSMMPFIHSSETISTTSCADIERRGSILSIASAKGFTTLRDMARRNSVFPSGCIPKISISESAEATPKKERKKKQNVFLEPPMWRYKEIKEEKKKKKAEQEKIAKDKKVKK